MDVLAISPISPRMQHNLHRFHLLGLAIRHCMCVCSKGVKVGKVVKSWALNESRCNVHHQFIEHKIWTMEAQMATLPYYLIWSHNTFLLAWTHNTEIGLGVWCNIFDSNLVIALLHYFSNNLLTITFHINALCCCSLWLAQEVGYVNM